jgi:hypothetical protein
MYIFTVRNLYNSFGIKRSTLFNHLLSITLQSAPDLSVLCWPKRSKALLLSYTFKCPLKKTQSFCPCSRALNMSGKRLKSTIFSCYYWANCMTQYLIFPTITTHIHNGNLQHKYDKPYHNGHTCYWLMQCSYTKQAGIMRIKTSNNKTENHTIKIFIKWKIKIATVILKCSSILAFREKSMAQRRHTKYVDTKQFLGVCKQGNEPSGSTLSSTVISYLASYNFCTHGSVNNTVMTWMHLNCI